MHLISRQGDEQRKNGELAVAKRERVANDLWSGPLQTEHSFNLSLSGMTMGESGFLP